MPTLPRRFRRNVLTTYVTMVVSAAQVLLVTPLLVRGLGPERYGIWTLVASFGLFAALLDLGLASATTRYVAHYEELGERPQLVRTINVSFWILLGLGTLVLLAGLLFAPLFPKVFEVPGEETAASVLVVLAAAAVALVVVGGTAQGSLAGLQRYGFLNLTYTSAVIVQATAFAIVLWLGGQIVALGIVLLSVVLAEQVARFLAMQALRPGSDALAAKRRKRVGLGDAPGLRLALVHAGRDGGPLPDGHDRGGVRRRRPSSRCLRRRPVLVHRRRPLHPAEPDRVLPVLRRVGRTPRRRKPAQRDGPRHAHRPRRRRPALSGGDSSGRPVRARLGRAWLRRRPPRGRLPRLGAPARDRQQDGAPDAARIRTCPGACNDRVGGGGGELRSQHRAGAVARSDRRGARDAHRNGRGQHGDRDPLSLPDLRRAHRRVRDRDRPSARAGCCRRPADGLVGHAR